MLLAIDVGNTNTVVALYDGDIQRQTKAGLQMRLGFC